MAKARTLVLNTKVNVTGADQLRGLGRTLQRTGGLLTAGLTLPLVGVGAAMLTAAQDAERAQAKLTNVFDSMGAAAFTSVKALNAHAEALQNATTFDDESINEAQAVLLTFGNVTGDAFTRATEAALDLSSLFEGDLQAATIQIGKALNDPIKGLTALSKVGVSFTQQQKDQIKALQQSGDLLGAQTIILAELERQFGGTAEALAGTAGGQMTQALNQLGEASEEFGKIIAPVLVDVAKGLKGFAKWLQQLNPETKEWVLRIGLLLAALGPVLVVVGSLVRVGVALSKVYQFLFVAKAVTELSRFGTALTTAGTAARTFMSLALGPLGIAVAAFTAGFATDFLGMRTRFEKDMGDIGVFLGDAGDAFRDFFGIVETGTAEMGETEKAGWAAYEQVLASRMASAKDIVATGVDDMAAEMGEAPGALADSLRANIDDYDKAMDELTEVAVNSVSDLAERQKIEGILAGQELTDALSSDSTRTRLLAQELVADLVSDYELLAPGALAAGKLVDPALADGINNNVGGAVAAAEALVDAAGLPLVDTSWAYTGGRNIGVAWANGLRSAEDHVKFQARLLTIAAKTQMMGLSPPKEGPLKDIDKGGLNIGLAWAKGLSGAKSAVSAVADSLAAAAIPGMAAIGFGKLSGLAAVPAGMGGGTTNIYNNFTFSGTPSGSPNELSSLLRDLSAVSGGDVRYG